jgi:hypothetical protein
MKLRCPSRLLEQFAANRFYRQLYNWSRATEALQFPSICGLQAVRNWVMKPLLLWCTTHYVGHQNAFVGRKMCEGIFVSASETFFVYANSCPKLQTRVRELPNNGQGGVESLGQARIGLRTSSDAELARQVTAWRELCNQPQM